MRNCVYVAASTLTVIGAMRLPSHASEAMTAPPDTIIVNGRVWTGAARAPRAEALAIAGDRITAVGTNDAVRAGAGPATMIIDARRRVVVPGLIDAHLHLIEGGLQLSRLDLRDTRDRTDFIQRIRHKAERTTPGEWIQGGRWSVESWGKPASPTKEWIDRATGAIPTFLTRMDGHQGLANSAALKLAGIDANGPPDPQGGIIERDPRTGEPTGILKDDAMALITRHIPPTSVGDRYDALHAAMGHLHQYGITSVHDMTDTGDLPAYAKARAEGALRLRVRSFLQVGDWDRHRETLAETPREDAWWSVPGFKGYVDGSLGSRTAFMRDRYSDAAAGARYPRGLLTDQADPFETFRAAIIRMDAERYQLAVHAIGDQAIHLLLDAYEAAAHTNGPRDRRLRVEHAQHLLPEDIARFGKLGVIASMQPLHKADDGRYAEDALGAKRCGTSYAFRSLLDAGAVLAFGSDWPVVSVNPFAGIEAAVTGRTLDGKRFVPEQNITVEEALRGYTVGGAFAAHREKDLGTLEVGKLADVAILSQNLLAVPPERLSDTRADITIVGGKIVRSAEE